MGCQKPNTKIVNTFEYKFDTVRISKFDTIREIIDGENTITIHRTDTFYVTNEVIKEKIVYEKCNDRTERIKAKFDYKSKADSLETILKLEREKTKQQKHTGQQAVDITKLNNKKDVKITRIENRSYWWLWLLIGFILSTIFWKRFKLINP